MCRVPPLHKELQATNGCQERETQSLPGICPLLVVQCTVVSIEIIYAQPAETDSASCTCIYLHMHICDNNNEWPQESSWEGPGEKIKVGSDKFYFNQHLFFFFFKNDVLISSYTKQDELTFSKLEICFGLFLHQFRRGMWIVSADTMACRAQQSADP